MPTTTTTIGARYGVIGAGEIEARLDDVRASMIRIRRAADRGALDTTGAAHQLALARRVAKFEPTGDLEDDRAALDTFERQAAVLQRLTNHR